MVRDSLQPPPSATLLVRMIVRVGVNARCPRRPAACRPSSAWLLLGSGFALFIIHLGLRAMAILREVNRPKTWCVRIYAGADGESHFSYEEIELSPVNFAPPVSPLNLSAYTPAKQFARLHGPYRWVGNRHPTPARQFMIWLLDEAEIEGRSLPPRSRLQRTIPWPECLRMLNCRRCHSDRA